MTRLAVVLLLASAAAAAPVPNNAAETEKITKLFGTPVDSDKDCRFRLDGEKLTITVPDKPHDLDPPLGAVSAPRTARDLKGDFVVRVKVVCKPPDNPNPADGKAGEYTAGLVLYGDKEHAVRMDIARRVVANGPGESQVQTRTWQVGASSGSATSDGRATPTTPLWLRITRRGNTVSSAYSHDGENWNTFSNHTGELPAALKVGVMAAHSCDTGFTATFEGFAVEPLADGK